MPTSLLTSQARMHAQCAKYNTVYSTVRRRASFNLHIRHRSLKSLYADPFGQQKSPLESKYHVPPKSVLILMCSTWSCYRTRWWREGLHQPPVSKGQTLKAMTRRMISSFSRKTRIAISIAVEEPICLTWEPTTEILGRNFCLIPEINRSLARRVG